MGMALEIRVDQKYESFPTCPGKMSGAGQQPAESIWCTMQKTSAE